LTAADRTGRRREKRKFFDRLAADWRRENLLTSRERELILRALPGGELDLPSPILDLGGGAGRLAGFFRELGVSLPLLFDISARMLEESPLISSPRLQGDAHHLPFKEQTVGLVFCFSAFPHFEGKEEVIRECVRILRPGGLLVILHSCAREEINRFHSVRDPIIAGDHLPPLESFRRWGESAGMIPERLDDSQEWFLVRYRKPGFR
jgi:demethylmenaquinone methyltransferase/2-methoxy-6-polyprenyl-1,4-benzoquinol methylase